MKDPSAWKSWRSLIPSAPWCWGSEPVLRKLETWYGDAIRIRSVMGGLVEDIRAFHDRANDIGGDPERSNAQNCPPLAESLGAPRHPVQTQGFRLFTAGDRLHLPAEHRLQGRRTHEIRAWPAR